MEKFETLFEVFEVNLLIQGFKYEIDTVAEVLAHVPVLDGCFAYQYYRINS